MLTLAPFEYALRRSLTQRRSLEEMASQTWILEQESTQRVRKAVYLEDTLGRASQAGTFSDLADQYNLIAAREVTHRPIKLHLLSNAALVGAAVYVREFREPLSPAAGFRPRDLLESTHCPQATLGCTYFGNMFFGHFWSDDVPLMQFGNQFADPVRTALPLTPHQRELLDLIKLKVRFASSMTFDELYCFDDRAQTKHKERRYRALRKTFADRYGRGDAPHGVFLFRGNSGSSRLLVNEQQIADALVPHGFVQVHPERLSLDELNRAIWGARVIVGVEGSQLVHGLYNAAEGASFLTLQPPMRFSNILKSYTDCLDMHYGFVIGQACEGGGYRVELDEVLRVLDLLEKRKS